MMLPRRLYKLYNEVTALEEGIFTTKRDLNQALSGLTVEQGPYEVVEYKFHKNRNRYVSVNSWSPELKYEDER